jgi:hypothetical protein
MFCSLCEQTPELAQPQVRNPFSKINSLEEADASAKLNDDSTFDFASIRVNNDLRKKKEKDYSWHSADRSIFG